ncbi:thymopoietin isoform X1 [Dromiciops gliroides]|uniref:thymopoietin isoform X1 n=1 Tax=Dromiciops gliroides TaxID=33562 RepID=UPI001CC6B457|nr:thymopoietin isoform X1 [Dromiciops gliroides]
MPEFLEDPSVLTKERLKSELLANNVTLPAGEQRKDVYVQLYLQHLTARNRPPPPAAQPPPPAAAANSRAPPDFSSDDEREPTPVLSAAGRGRGGAGAAAGRKATKKTDKPRSEENDDFDVTELTNEELLSQLVKYGVNPGPIVGTTRKLYEKKLLKLREHGPESRSSTPLPAVSSTAENARQNGNDDSDRYSDTEEGKKKEHEKVKSTRESVRISELPTSPSGGFFQAVSFPEIRARPPLGWTELQAAKRGHSSDRDPFRDPLSASSSLDIGQAEKVVLGEAVFSSPKYDQDRFLGKSTLSSSQSEPFATLASAAAKASCSPALKDPTTSKCLRDHLENICGGKKYEFSSSSFTERTYFPAQSGPSKNREKLDILENSQVITPPLAQAIRDYVNSLLIKAGASNLPGLFNPSSASVENPPKEVGLSRFQETESMCSPPKFPRLHERSVKEGDSGFLHVSQDNVAPSALAKMIISQSLGTLGIETSKECQHDTLSSPEPSFPLHESILKVIDEEWSHIDRQIPSVSSKYPVSSRETSNILSVPKVDDEILELTPDVTSPASTQACNKELDLSLCRTYEAAAGALQIATHTAFVARAIQTDIGQVAHILSSDPSKIPEALETLSKTYDAASFLCDAAFDEVRMAACAMGSSTVGRRHLWLNNDKISPTHKNKLSGLPLKGGTLFGGEVQKVIKKRGKRQ